MLIFALELQNFFINLQKYPFYVWQFANYVTVFLISHDFVVTDAHLLPCFYLGQPSKIPRVSNSNRTAVFQVRFIWRSKFVNPVKYIVLKSKESVLICHPCSNCLKFTKFCNEVEVQWFFCMFCVVCFVVFSVVVSVVCSIVFCVVFSVVFVDVGKLLHRVKENLRRFELPKQLLSWDTYQ